MRTLDKSKPFGQVVGATNTTAFIQDGVNFDSAGNEILSAADQAQADADALRAAEEAKKPAAGAHDALLALSVDKVKAELATMTLEVLHAVRAAEAAGHARVTLLAAIDAEIAAKDQLANQLG